MEESLFLNTLAFEFPAKPKFLYFSMEDRKNISLTKLSYKQFPVNINAIFPDITTTDTIYTSFDKKIDHFQALEINFHTENFVFIQRYYNHLIKNYFTQKNHLVEKTYINDNKIWLRNSGDKPYNHCILCDKYTIKVNFNYFTNTPELVLSYDRTTNVYRKSVATFLSNEEHVTADLIKRVVYVKHIQCGDRKITRKKVTSYKHLQSQENIDYNNVYPIVGPDFATWLGVVNVVESQNQLQKKNRYIKYLNKISDFYSHFLNKDEFRNIISISHNGFDKAKPSQIGKINPLCQQLMFGKNNRGENAIDVHPKDGVTNGPFNQPHYNNIQMFFISAADHVPHIPILSSYLKTGYKTYKGLLHYTNVPITLAPKSYSIAFTNAPNPLPEIEKKLENTDWLPSVKYLAIYLAPVGKHTPDHQQRKIYYQIKEKLLIRNIASQCIETEKMLKVLANDIELEQAGKKGDQFADILQNIAIAINAKLGGVPWRINTPISNELVIGVGAFKNTETNVPYIASAFSFDNTGFFNSFDYFHKDKTTELAGSIEAAIIRYTHVHEKPSRVIVHFFKEMSEKEIKPLENTLHNLSLDIPVFVVTIDKPASEDFIVFDHQSADKMPYSGRYINLGNNTYLLCNNTRYEGNPFHEMEGFPFPVKLKISCPTDCVIQSETKIINELIDQVYQFSRIYWKSINQQNLPVTIKYPQMIAQIASNFIGGVIPSYLGNDNLWFL